MKLTAPTQLFFIVSAVLVILALIGHFQSVQYITGNQFWLAVIGYIVLAFACIFRRA